MSDNELTFMPADEKLGRQSPLSEHSRAALLVLPHRIVTLYRDAYIVREGERISHCTMVLSGFAYAYKLIGDGARQVLAVHVRGDLIDLHCASGVSRSTLQPLSSVTVALIPRTALLELAADHVDIAQALWAEGAIVNSILGEWLLNVERRDARRRICHLLCELALRQEAAASAPGRTMNDQ